MIPSDKKALQQRSPTKTDRVCRKLLRLGLIQTFLGFSCTVLACVCLDHLRHHHVLAALSGGALFCSFCVSIFCGTGDGKWKLATQSHLANNNAPEMSTHVIPYMSFTNIYFTMFQLQIWQSSGEIRLGQ